MHLVTCMWSSSAIHTYSIITMTVQNNTTAVSLRCAQGMCSFELYLAWWFFATQLWNSDLVRITTEASVLMCCDLRPVYTWTGFEAVYKPNWLICIQFTFNLYSMRIDRIHTPKHGSGFMSINCWLKCALNSAFVFLSAWITCNCAFGCICTMRIAQSTSNWIET